MNIGKIPPQAIELERAILGAIILESNLLENVKLILTDNSFYNTNHQLIYRAILQLEKDLQPIDMLTLINKLRDLNQLDIIGGSLYIANLVNDIGSGVNIVEHSKIVAEKYIRRKLITMAHKFGSSMYEEIDDLYTEILAYQDSINQTIEFTKKEEKHIKEAVLNMVDYSIMMRKNEVEKGIKTGFTYFDEFSGGIQKGDLMIIAGETSNGKTTLAINMAKNAAYYGTRIGIFSFEMTVYQLAARFFAYDQNISSKDIIRGNIDETDLINLSFNAGNLVNSEIYIVKPSGTSFDRLANEIKRMVKLYNLDLIVIDYLQLISNIKRNGSTADSVAEICNNLKSLAVELNIALILISQLSRDNQSRPSLRRLKGSGDIENAADIVMFTYWAHKYGVIVDVVNGDKMELEENEVIITVAKGRNIGTCEFLLNFNKDIPAFYNYVKKNEAKINIHIYPPTTSPF